MILICLIFFVYALLHFVFESIVAPSVRFNLRLDLFALRDAARRLRIKNPQIGDEAFSAVQEGINGAIKYLYEVDLPILLLCDAAVKRDPELKERVEKRKATVLAAGSPELVDIIRQLRGKVETAAAINNGGWLFYIIPVAVAVFTLKRVCKPIFSILYLSNYELEKIVPQNASGVLAPA